MNKRGLGRGLEVLIPRPSSGPEKGATEIRIDLIRPNPYQPRRDFDDASIEELAQSIRAHGVIQPITVRPVDGAYEIAAGERRWRAAKYAGLGTIPAIVKPFQDEEMLQVALVENLQREDINPIEAARAYQQLMDLFGDTQEQIAQGIGKSRTAVSNTLRLLKLPLEIQERISSGHLTEGHGRALLAIEDEAERRKIWRKIEADGLSVREAERLVRQAGRAREKATGRPSGKAARRDPNLQAIEEELQRSLGTRVEIRYDKRTARGTIAISYYSFDDLERLARLLSAYGQLPASVTLGLTNI